MITRHFRRLAIAGDSAYQLLMRANRWVNFVRERYGMPYWSLSAYAKHQVKRAVNLVSEFEHAVARDAVWTGSSVAISIMRRSARCMASDIRIAAIGWRAAPR